MTSVFFWMCYILTALTIFAYLFKKLLSQKIFDEIVSHWVLR